MKNFRIGAFLKNQTILYTRQVEGNNARSVCNKREYYVHGTDRRKLLDFLCEQNSRIYSVLKYISKTVFDEEIQIGNEVYIGESGTSVVRGFRIENGEVLVLLSTIVTPMPITKVTKKKPVKKETVVSQKETKSESTAAQLVQINENENASFKPTVKKIVESFKGQTIRLEKTLKKRKESPEVFLKEFFLKNNNEKNTIFVSSGGVQTAPGKRRSLGDIYMIMRYYYPNITLNQVLYLLYHRMTSIPHFRSSMCSQINKRVWYVGKNNQESAVYDKESSDEFGHTYSWYADRITN